VTFNSLSCGTWPVWKGYKPTLNTDFINSKYTSNQKHENYMSKIESNITQNILYKNTRYFNIFSQYRLHIYNKFVRLSEKKDNIWEDKNE
jgi:hypothetical protein